MRLGGNSRRTSGFCPGGVRRKERRRRWRWRWGRRESNGRRRPLLEVKAPIAQVSGAPGRHRSEADWKPKLLSTRHSCQPGLRQLAGRLGWFGGRWYPEPQCAPPGDWPGSRVGGGGDKESEARGRACFVYSRGFIGCVNLIELPEFTRLGTFWLCRLQVKRGGGGGGVETGDVK